MRVYIFRIGFEDQEAYTSAYEAGYLLGRILNVFYEQQVAPPLRRIELGVVVEEVPDIPVISLYAITAPLTYEEVEQMDPIQLADLLTEYEYKELEYEELTEEEFEEFLRGVEEGVQE